MPAPATVPTGLIDQLTAILLGYGLIGAVAVVLGIVCIVLWKRNNFLTDTLFKVGNDAIAGNMAQANASQAMTKALESNQAAIARMNDNIILLTAGKRNVG